MKTTEKKEEIQRLERKYAYGTPKEEFLLSILHSPRNYRNKEEYAEYLKVLGSYGEVGLHILF